MKSVILLTLSMLAGMSAFAQSKQCSVGSTNGINYRFSKALGQHVFRPTSGPLKDLVVGVSIDQSSGYNATSSPGAIEQVDIFKKDFLKIKIAIFSKDEFWDLESANGQRAASYLRIQNLNQPFHLGVIEGTGTNGDPDSYEHSAWLHCD